jgi:hypothetical protein
MRLFVFAIGGTGSKVLTQFVMMLAAGVRPLDATGKPFSVVPIIIDPHVDNEGLQQVDKLLTCYRNIRKRIYENERDDTQEGFFSVKVETLKDTGGNEGSDSDDKFYLRDDALSDSEFSEFIGLNGMTVDDSDFCHLIFSKEELETKMAEGFYGSPNIGCVALRDFVHSQDFKNICDRFNMENGDRMFFIGSLFGGTGAAGLPLLISSIRSLVGDVSTKPVKSPIGALMMLPYFSIKKDENAQIDQADWVIKTKSALSYYEKNLDKYINAIYYVNDNLGSTPYDHDDGKDNQKANKAHIAEFCGALSLFDFAGIAMDKLDYGDKGVKDSDCHYNGYSFKSIADKPSFSFKYLPPNTNKLIMKPFMKFYIMENFMKNSLKSYSNKPFAKQLGSVLNMTGDDYLMRFFKEFDQFFNEMKEQDNRKLNLFNQVTDDYTKAFVDVEFKKKFLGSNKITASDLVAPLNKENNNYKDGTDNPYNRWFTIANIALDKFIDEHFVLTECLN